MLLEYVVLSENWVKKTFLIHLIFFCVYKGSSWFWKQPVSWPVLSIWCRTKRNSDQRQTVMETCLKTVICAFSCHVNDTHFTFKLLLIKFIPLSLAQQTVSADKNKLKHGKPNKWKPRREKLGLACIWLVRMPFGNARAHTHTHTPGPFKYLSLLYGPTLGQHNEADALRKKRRVWFFIYAQWIPALSF